jgi:hypothetical protein
MPCSGSKSTNSAAKPSARSRATTRSVAARSWLLWLMNTEAIDPSPRWRVVAVAPTPVAGDREGANT